MASSAAPFTIGQLRALLASSRPRDNLAAIDAAALMHEAAVPLVADLMRFLTSEAYVPSDQREHSFSGHAILAEDATGAIEEIGVGPDIDALRRLFDDCRVIIMPEASFDQGAYIGDYGSTTFSPAGLAARLVPLQAENGLKLMAELAVNACDEADEVGKPARRAIGKLARFAATAPAAERDAFVAEIDRIAGLPQAVAPTISLGFDLRDLVRHCRKVLGG